MKRFHILGKLGRIAENYSVLFLMFFSFAISILLRIYRLGSLPFWNDESFSFFAAKYSIYSIFKSDVNMSFFHFIAHFWLTIIPNYGEFCLRLLPLAFSALCVPMFFLLGGHFGNDKRDRVLIASFSAFLLAINTFHVQYAQEFRGYSLLVLLVIVATHSLIKIVEVHAERNGGEQLWWFVYVISSALALYTHLFAVLILIAQLLTIILFYKTRRKIPLIEICGAFAAIFSFFLPLLVVVLDRGSGQIAWIVRPNTTILIKTITDLYGKTTLLYAVICLVLSIIGTVIVFVRHKQMSIIKIWKYVLVIMSGSFPLAFSYLFSIFFKPIFLSHYLLVIEPYILLQLVVSLFAIGSMFKSATNKYIFLSAALLIITMQNTSSQLIYFTQYKKEEWKQASNYLMEQCSNQNSLRLYYMPFIEHNTTYYNLSLSSQNKFWANGIANQKIDIYKQNGQKYDKVCLVISHVETNDQTVKRAEQILLKTHPKQKSQQLYRVKIDIFSR